MFLNLPARVLHGALFCWLLVPAFQAQENVAPETVSDAVTAGVLAGEAESSGEAGVIAPGPSNPFQTDAAAVELPSLDNPEDGNLSLFPRLKVDLMGSGSYLYDSNTSQTANGDSASLFAFTYATNIRSSDPDQRGGFFGFDYLGQYFLYTDSTDALGRDPHEVALGSFFGLNGAKTRLRLDLDYRANNGNSFSFDNINRETRRTASDDYTFRFGLSRDLFRGTLETGAGYSLRDFEAGSGFSDGESTYGDLAWFTTPSFAPKSAMGLGLRFGSDDYDGQSPQDYFTPSYRWRYRLSGKTTVHNSFGYESRSDSSAGGRETENLVYDGGIEWAPTPKTGIGLAYYRRVQPSFVVNGEDVTSTGVSVNLTNQLPLRFLLRTRVGFESASYEADGSAVPSGRDDDFMKLSLDLSHPLQITDRLRGEWAIFFNHNQNDSTLAPFSFDQNVAGIRFGLIY